MLLVFGSPGTQRSLDCLLRRHSDFYGSLHLGKPYSMDYYSPTDREHVLINQYHPQDASFHSSASDSTVGLGVLAADRRSPEDRIFYHSSHGVGGFFTMGWGGLGVSEPRREKGIRATHFGCIHCCFPILTSGRILR